MIDTSGPKVDVKKLKILNSELHTIFTADESAKKVFLQYCLLFTIAASPLWQNNLRPMFTGHATAYYKEDAMVSNDKFMFDFEKVIFKLIQ